MSNAEDGNFIVGFVKECFDRGLSEDQTMILYDAAVWRDNLKDPDFHAGFKEASDAGRLNPFSVMGDKTRDFSKGSLVGGVLGGIGGLAALRKGKLGLAKKMMFGGAAGAPVGGLINMGIGAGSRAAERAGIPEEWAPDYLVPGMDAVNKVKKQTGNAFSGMSGFTNMGDAAGAATSTAGQYVQPVAMGRQLQQEVASLDKQMETLRSGMSSGEGLSGALSNRRIQSQLDTLAKKRDSLMRGIGDAYNGVRQDQATSSKSIADRLAGIEGAIESRSGRAADAAAWLEATRGNSLGNLPARLWNKVVGAEGNASDLSYELERLRDERERLLDLQGRVGGML